MSITVAVNVSLRGLTRPMAGVPKRTTSPVHQSRRRRYEGILAAPSYNSIDVPMSPAGVDQNEPLDLQLVGTGMATAVALRWKPILVIWPKT
jgi:hypothetical protein